MTLMVRPSEMFRETFLGQGAEQLTERMPWWNLRPHIHLSHIPKTPKLIIADDWSICRCRHHNLLLSVFTR